MTVYPKSTLVQKFWLIRNSLAVSFQVLANRIHKILQISNFTITSAAYPPFAKEIHAQSEFAMGKVILFFTNHQEILRLDFVLQRKINVRRMY